MGRRINILLASNSDALTVPGFLPFRCLAYLTTKFTYCINLVN